MKMSAVTDATSNVEDYALKRKLSPSQAPHTDARLADILCSRCGLGQKDIKEQCPLATTVADCSALIGLNATNPGYNGVRCQSHYMCVACWFHKTDSPYGDRNTLVEKDQFKKALVGEDKDDNAVLVPKTTVTKCVGCWHDRYRKKKTKVDFALKRVRQLSPATQGDVIVIGNTPSPSEFPPKDANVAGASPFYAATIKRSLLKKYLAIKSEKELAKFLEDNGEFLAIDDDINDIDDTMRVLTFDSPRKI